jgi:hypothetical protein
LVGFRRPFGASVPLDGTCPLEYAPRLAGQSEVIRGRDNPRSGADSSIRFPARPGAAKIAPLMLFSPRLFNCAANF